MTASTRLRSDLLILILVRSMRPHQVNRTEALVLIVVAVGCFVGAWFSYSGHPVTDSNLYAPDIPGWVHLFLFVFIGVIVRLTYISSRRRRIEKDNGSDAARKT
jgi:TRAP-type C4-dicarboxylate transport system permease small subunit